MKEYWIDFSGEREGLVFLLSSVEGGAYGCDAAHRLESAAGMEVTGKSLRRGVTRLHLLEGRGGEVCLRCGEGVVPFLMPGPGITPSHFAKPAPSVRLAANRAYSLTVPIARGQENLYLAYQKGDGGEAELEIMEDRRKVAPHWYPECAMPYRCARIDVRSEALSVEIRTRSATRLTVWEGNPLLMDNTDAPMPVGWLSLCAVDEHGEALDARFEVYAGDELVLQRDVLAGESCVAELPEGCYNVRVHHGNRYSRASVGVVLRAGETREIRAELSEWLPLKKGWVWGDAHMHSVYEDGAPLPDMIMRAARATGSNFAFLTDHQVEQLKDFGVSQADKPGTFVGMAGQEIICHELHMNVLNAPWEVKDAMLHYRQVNGDICDRIRGWLDEIDRMREVQPVTFMLNHPYHSKQASERPWYGYMRSWWVADRFPEFGIVENFDFLTWFDHLNRGDRLTGIWTTDSHDCSRLFAGKKGTCVYVGEELTPAAIIDALNHGHAFSARWPGATLYLSVNGTMMGDTLRAKKGEKRMARVEAASALPMREIEIVTNGSVTVSVQMHGEVRADVEAELPGDALWAVARLRVEGGEWPQDDHCFEPLMTSGCIAFTNPVYIQEVEA